MPSTPSLEPPHRALLLEVAMESIRSGLREKRALCVDPALYPEPLREVRASFVSLHRGGQLRGCTGHLEASDPLVADVAQSAHQSAFADPRFSPLAEWELADLVYEDFTLYDLAADPAEQYDVWAQHLVVGAALYADKATAPSSATSHRRFGLPPRRSSCTRP